VSDPPDYTKHELLDRTYLLLQTFDSFVVARAEEVGLPEETCEKLLAASEALAEAYLALGGEP
jgi:hypothetical protein